MVVRAEKPSAIKPPKPETSENTHLDPIIIYLPPKSALLLPNSQVPSCWVLGPLGMFTPSPKALSLKRRSARRLDPGQRLLPSAIICALPGPRGTRSSKAITMFVLFSMIFRQFSYILLCPVEVHKGRKVVSSCENGVRVTNC